MITFFLMLYPDQESYMKIKTKFKKVFKTDRTKGEKIKRGDERWTQSEAALNIPAKLVSCLCRST